jgi:hypothetical protein
METLTSGLEFFGFVIVVGIGVVIHYALWKRLRQKRNERNFDFDILPSRFLSYPRGDHEEIRVVLRTPHRTSPTRLFNLR